MIHEWVVSNSEKTFYWFLRMILWIEIKVCKEITKIFSQANLTFQQIRICVQTEKPLPCAPLVK